MLRKKATPCTWEVFLSIEDHLKCWASFPTLKWHLLLFLAVYTRLLVSNRMVVFAAYTRLAVPQISRDPPVSASYLAVKWIIDTSHCMSLCWFWGI